MCPHNGDDSIHISRLFANAAVLVYTHRRVMLQCDGSKDLIMTDDKPIQRCSLHHSRSQMTMVMAMTITVDNLLPRPKLDCNGGYDTAVKGPSVVVSRIRDGFQLELDWTSAITWMTWTPTLVPFVSMSCFDGVMSSSTSPLLLPLG